MQTHHAPNINNFEIFVQNLTKLGDTWGGVKFCQEFKYMVGELDYDMELRTYK